MRDVTYGVFDGVICFPVSIVFVWVFIYSVLSLLGAGIVCFTGREK